jgi:hypothetical protein
MLILFLTSNLFAEDIAGNKIILRSDGGGGDDCFDFPISEDEQYLSTNQFIISVYNSRNGFPGQNLPNAFLYVYYQEFDNMVSLVGPLVFQDVDEENKTISTQALQIYLENLSYLKNNCDPFFEENFFVALVSEMDGEYILYDEIHPEIFPSWIFDSESIIESFEEEFCCTSIHLSKEYGLKHSNFNKSKPKIIEKAQDENQRLISIFPNPTVNILNIYFNEIISKEEEIQISLFSIDGKLMHRNSTYCNESRIASFSVQHLKTGMYIVRIKMKGEIFNMKFLKP